MKYEFIRRYLRLYKIYGRSSTTKAIMDLTAHDDSINYSDRQAGVEIIEIEVTSEMIEAGIAYVWDFFGDHVPLSSELMTDVFWVMRAFQLSSRPAVDVPIL